MIYKDFKGIALSSLGMGAMRLPQKSNVYADIDVDATAEMVDYAIKNGVNYFDTAWGYHDGESENVMGKVLSAYPRDSFYLATKFPGYDLSNMPKVKEIFTKQLEKCRVDYFDFYLIHNVCEMNIDAYLDPKYHIKEYLVEQKRLGKIKHLGFSAHGSIETMKRFLEVYGDEMEFCQIQLNYLDYSFQDAKGKMELLKEHNLPVWVMEPLRGGKLARLDAASEEKLKALRPNEGIPAWAFRFLQSLDQVVMILSGMSNFAQLEDNIKTFAESKPLNQEEMKTILEIADKMLSKKTLPCTRCRYCTSHCPMQLPIPDIIELYNEDVFTGGGFIAPMKIAAMPEEQRPSACIGCKSCEAVCPQQIKISEMMSDFARRLKGE